MAMYRNNIGMVQTRSGFRFSTKSIHQILITFVTRQDFHSQPSRQSWMLGFVNNPHATLTDLMNHSVTGQQFHRFQWIARF
jgi:hypothetical protein